MTILVIKGFELTMRMLLMKTAELQERKKEENVRKNSLFVLYLFSKALTCLAAFCFFLGVVLVGFWRRCVTGRERERDNVSARFDSVFAVF